MAEMGSVYQFLKADGTWTDPYEAACYGSFGHYYLGGCKSIRLGPRHGSIRPHREKIFNIIKETFDWFPNLPWDTWYKTYVELEYKPLALSGPGYKILPSGFRQLQADAYVENIPHIEVSPEINPHVLFAIVTMLRIPVEFDQCCNFADKWVKEIPEVSWWEHLLISHTNGFIPFLNHNHAIIPSNAVGPFVLRHREVSLRETFEKHPLCDPKISVEKKNCIRGNLHEIVCSRGYVQYPRKNTLVNPQRGIAYQQYIYEYLLGYPQLVKLGFISELVGTQKKAA